MSHPKFFKSSPNGPPPQGDYYTFLNVVKRKIGNFSLHNIQKRVKGDFSGVRKIRDGNYSGTRFPGDGKRRTSKGRPQGLKQRAVLLAHGGEVTADGAKGADPFGTAKGPRDLLLHLDHA